MASLRCPISNNQALLTERLLSVSRICITSSFEREHAWVLEVAAPAVRKSHFKHAYPAGVCRCSGTFWMLRVTIPIAHIAPKKGVYRRSAQFCIHVLKDLFVLQGL